MTPPLPCRPVRSEQRTKDQGPRTNQPASPPPAPPETVERLFIASVGGKPHSLVSARDEADALAILAGTTMLEGLAFTVAPAPRKRAMQPPLPFVLRPRFLTGPEPAPATKPPPPDKPVPEPALPLCAEARSNRPSEVAARSHRADHRTGGNLEADPSRQPREGEGPMERAASRGMAQDRSGGAEAGAAVRCRLRSRRRALWLL